MVYIRSILYFLILYICSNTISHDSTCISHIISAYLYLYHFYYCISLPKGCIPMYTGYILCTYSFTILVFYLNLASMYVKPVIRISYTSLWYIAYVYQCIQVVYRPVFQLSKVESSFTTTYFTAINPYFKFCSPVRLWSVYKCIYNMYKDGTQLFQHLQTWFTAPFPGFDEPAINFQQCISTCSLTCTSIYQFLKGWTTREYWFHSSNRKKGYLL